MRRGSRWFGRRASASARLGLAWALAVAGGPGCTYDFDALYGEETSTTTSPGGPALVGSYVVGAGPAGGVASCVEACATNFGGTPDGYTCSTEPGRATGRGHVHEVEERQDGLAATICRERDGTYAHPETPCDPGYVRCLATAWFAAEGDEDCAAEVNYCFR